MKKIELILYLYYEENWNKVSVKSSMLREKSLFSNVTQDFEDDKCSYLHAFE